MAFDEWWAKQPKMVTEPITPRMAWNAALTAANERITNALAMVDEANALAKRNGLALMTEREVSDKMEKALKEIAAIEGLGIDDDQRNTAAHTLADVAAIRVALIKDVK